MKCPHCHTAFFENWKPTPISQTVPPGTWYVFWQICPACNRFIIKFTAEGGPDFPKSTQWIAYPKGAIRPIPPEVPDPYRQDFMEACLVLPDSEKASAALARRCLQAVLRNEGRALKKDLADQIDEMINGGKLPSHITEGLHAVRNIGNFAAHPIKSTSTGMIVEVEAGEAEWTLDVIESLFDFFFVQPALTTKRKAELNKKLRDAGKPEIK
jgi:hypothetical protein